MCIHKLNKTALELNLTHTFNLKQKVSQSKIILRLKLCNTKTGNK